MLSREQQLQKEITLWCPSEFWDNSGFNIFLTISKTNELKNIAFSAQRVPFIIQTLRERNFLLTIWDGTMAKIFTRLTSGMQCAFFVLGRVAKRFFQLIISRPQNWKGNDLRDGGGINICLHFLRCSWAVCVQENVSQGRIEAEFVERISAGRKSASSRQ